MDRRTTEPDLPLVLRAGPLDQGILAALAALTAAAAPVSAWASGPYLWPLGCFLAAVFAGACLALILTWASARGQALWDGETLTLPGGRVLRADDLRRWTTRPAAGITVLRFHQAAWVLSHRREGAEAFLRSLARRRPELSLERPLLWRTVRGGLVFQALLALTALGTSFPARSWSLAASVVLAIGAAAAGLRCLVSIPLSYRADAGTLEVRYLLRRQRWRGATSWVEDDHVTAGCSHHRIRIGFPGATVALDEADLADPLGPEAERLRSGLFPPGP